MVPGGWYIDYKNYKAYKEGKEFTIYDPYGTPVTLVIDDSLIHAYNYYYTVYKNCDNYGLPFDKWTDAPPWLLQLIEAFRGVINDIRLAARQREGKIRRVIWEQ